MRRAALFTLLIAGAALGLAGCGAKNDGGEGEPTASAPPATSPATTPPPATGAPASTSKFDAGPRAGEAPVNGALAAKGERLFNSKACMVCHGFGKVITCPDLVGVSMRRTARWMEEQMLHPEVMVKEDPIARELKKLYSLPMTNQGLTADEARSVIEFLKRKDRQAGAKGMAP
jgi:cytochrome c551/c552